MTTSAAGDRCSRKCRAASSRAAADVDVMTCTIEASGRRAGISGTRRYAALRVSLPYTPAVDGTAVKKIGRRHDAVLLEDLAVFHNELHVFQRVDILQRVSR